MTPEQYQALLNRMVVLERHVNNLTVAQDRLASLSQVRELQVVVQRDLADLQQQVTALTNRLNILEQVSS